jgi:diadenosine tetraphosphate (Ap4A) HIT family hydrolase
MPTYQITLDDAAAQQLDAVVARSGLTPGSLLSAAISSYGDYLGHESGPSWMPRERWDALVRGDNCPMCAEISSVGTVDDRSLIVADLAVSRLRLADNQGVEGYCLLMSRRHVCKIYDLSEEEQHQYFGDLVRSARTLERVYQPVKMNFQILGNAVPHLHCHLKPRYYEDSAPGAPIWPERFPRRLTAAEYAERAERIRTALSAS